MDFKILYQNMLDGKYSDFELTLSDPDETIVLKLHKIILDSCCPYFRAMFSFNNKQSSDKMIVDDVNIMKDIIMTFYCLENTINMAFPSHYGDNDLRWYYLLQRTKCSHYLGLETRSEELYDLQVPPEGFDLLWNVVNHYDIIKNEQLLWLVKNNLPENYDLSFFPKEIAQELNKPDYLGVSITGDSLDVRVYNLQKDKFMYYCQNNSSTKKIISAICSPNNELMAISYSDQTIDIINIKLDFKKKSNNFNKMDINSKTIVTLKSKETGNNLSCMQFSPDNIHIAAAYTSGCINIWEILTGVSKYNFIYDECKNSYHCIKFSPDNKHIAAATQSNIFIWNLETKLLYRIIECNNIINISFSSNGETMVLANNDNIEMWNIDKNICLRTINFPGKIKKMGFCSDAKLMAISNDEYIVTIYDMESGNQKNSLRQPDNPRISNISFSKDGKFIATSGGGPKIWHTTSGNYIERFNGRCGKLIIN